MNFNIFPSSKKALQRGFVLLLVILSFLGGVFVAKIYFDVLIGQKNEEYSKELAILQEQIIAKEIEHTKEVSLLKSEYQKSLRQKVVREIDKDGSSTETIETESDERKVEIVEKIVEVEKEVVKYVDRVVEVEKEKEVIVSSSNKWSLGISATSSLEVPYVKNFSLDLGYSITDNFEVFTSLDSELTFRLGLRLRF